LTSHDSCNFSVSFLKKICPEKDHPETKKEKVGIPEAADQLADVGMARNCGGWQLDGGGIMD